VEQDRDMADKVLRDIPVSFPILFDDNNLVSQLYDVDAMPVTVLVDRNGDIRFMHRGYKPGYEQKYEQQVRALVKE
jgi:peroxiredoxin